MLAGGTLYTRQCKGLGRIPPWRGSVTVPVRLPVPASSEGFQTAQRTVCMQARLAKEVTEAAWNGNKAHGE